MIKNYIRTMIHSFFPKNEAVSLETTNPYVAARQEWNFMFGDIVKAKYNWQCISLILGIINIVLAIGLIAVSLQSRFIPYAVKVDNLGNANFAGVLTKQNAISPLMVNAMVRRYIIEARSVVADPVVQKHQLDFVYQCTMGSAKTVLDNFYHAQNPFDIVKNETVDVQVNSVLSKSNNTWQIHWTEVHRDSDGHVHLENHFEGLVTMENHTPSNIDEININPLGLYVTHLSWASQQ